MNLKRRALIISFVFLILLGVSLILRFFGGSFSAYSSDLIAICALVIVIWKEFLNPKPAPRREYHISPQNLEGRRLDKPTLKVIALNTGEIAVTLRFSWIDIDNSDRLIFDSLKDSTKTLINSDVSLPPNSEKELYITFTEGENTTHWKKVQETVSEATQKKDMRLVDGLNDLGARLCWSDASGRSQEVRIPIGIMIKELTKYKIDHPIGAIKSIA